MKTSPNPKAEQAIKLLLANPKFNTAVDALRIKWGVHRKDPKREENAKKLAKSHSTPWKFNDDVYFGEADAQIINHPNSPYYKDLMNLMRRFKLDRNYWLAVLWQYVRTGEYNHNDFYSEAMPIVGLKKYEDTRMTKVVLEIGAETTLKDVKAEWHRVEEMKKLVYGKPKFKLWKNFERDSRIYALYAEGKTVGEIWGQVKDEFENQDIGFSNIRKVVSTFKKRFGIENKRKLETSRIKRVRN